MYKESKIIYFEKGGPENTEITLGAALERAKELGIEHVIVASGRGDTALKLLSLARDNGYGGQIVVVSSHAGFTKPGEMMLTAEVRSELEGEGAKVFLGTHALSSVSRSFRLRWQGIDMLETVAETLRRFSQGIKTGIEITIMAADAGLIPVDGNVVAVAGTGRGADSAAVLKPAHMNSFFDLKVREIIAMPLE
jgi:hypothetical protein